MPLTSRQLRFCQEYIIDPNATQAAIKAGYSPKTARQVGDENLSKPYILMEIEKHRQVLRNKMELTAEMITKELRALGFWNINDFLLEGNEIRDITQLSREKTIPLIGIKVKVSSYTLEDGKVVKEITTELKFSDKRAALVDLGKYLGIFEKDNRQKGRKIIVTRK
ncbi:MAG: terminase small subunit [Chitinophagaceae bacterium]